jgi:hypothetical protein
MQKQLTEGDQIKTVVKLHYKQWWKLTKTIKFKWTVIGNEQFEPQDARELRNCLNRYFGNK